MTGTGKGPISFVVTPQQIAEHPHTSLSPRDYIPSAEQKEKKLTPPSTEQLEQWMWDRGGCEATDGCFVDPDGHCEHGKPSWLLVMGMI